MSTKKMHETMLLALSPYTEANQIPKEIEIAMEFHKKEIEELTINHIREKTRLQEQVASLKVAVEEKESTEQELSELLKEREGELEIVRAELERMQRLNEDKLRKVEEETQRHKDALEFDAHLKVSNLNTEIEKLRFVHNTELEQLKSKSEETLSEIKKVHDEEKQLLEERIAKLQTELLNLQSQPRQRTGSKDCLEEIRELNVHLDTFKKQSKEEMIVLKKQREEYKKKAEALEEELVALKHTMRNAQLIHEQSTKNFKQKLEKAQQAMEANENSYEELQKARKQIIELRNTITKLETNERHFKGIIANKEKEVEEVKENCKQKISNERKKAIQAHESYTKIKEECNHKNAVVAVKDELIESLTKKLGKGLRSSKEKFYPESSFNLECTL
jgi:DNA repair exonuclease SbcCD ATPase subunit